MTDTAQASVTEDEFEAQLPGPVGYKLLVAMPQVEEAFEGTELLKSVTTKNHEQIMSIMGVIIDMGMQAYSAQDRFPTGPWCKVGDYVMFRANTGTRFTIDGSEYRLMNDDSVEAVILDPRGIERV